MNITVKKGLDVTDSLEQYIEEKLAPLAKLISHFEREGDVELWVEVSRTTNHHRKGEEVFMATADLRLPGKILRSETTATDIRKAIDDMRNMLHMEIEKYKSKHARPDKAEREK